VTPVDLGTALRAGAGRRLSLAGSFAAALAVTILALWVMAASPAHGHAILLSTDPADGAVLPSTPAEVTLVFNEPVRLGESGMNVLDAGGSTVEVEARTVDREVRASFPQDLSDGTYIVSWRVVSNDSHPISGAFTFSVGAPSSSVVSAAAPQASAFVEYAYGGMQGLAYVGVFAAAGLLGFLVLLLPADVAQHRRTGQRLRRLAWLGAGVAAAAFLLLLPLTTARQEAGGAGTLLRISAWTDQLGSPEGLQTFLVVAGLVIGLVAVGRRTPPRGQAPMAALALSGAALALGALALVGHTRTFGPAWLVVSSDLLHVAAGALWSGGLLGLVVALAGRSDSGRREDDEKPDAVPVRSLAGMVAAFSSTAAVLVAVLTVCGVVLGWRIVGSWSALVSTTYGWLLVTKIALAALAVAFAAWNRFGLIPRLRSDADAPSALARLHRSVRVEGVVLAVVLLVTGFLVSKVPGDDDAGTAAPTTASQSSSVDTEAALGTGTIRARLTPGAVGVNSLELTLVDADGAPLEPVEDPVVSVSLPAAEVGPLVRPVAATGPGAYQATLDLPLPGRWEITVSARLSRFEAPVATLPVEVR
jgi:copper transport protein